MKTSNILKITATLAILSSAIFTNYVHSQTIAPPVVAEKVECACKGSNLFRSCKSLGGALTCHTGSENCSTGNRNC